MKKNDRWFLPVPLNPDRKQIDKLSNLLTCTDEEAVETWHAIIEIFEKK